MRNLLKRPDSMITLKGNQRGDTIVEVLIAVGIISLVLVAAYSTTNRNARLIQAAQEQGQALKLVERQLEFLRSRGTISSGACFNAAGTAVSGGACALTSAGTPAPVGYAGAIYTMSIVKNGSGNYEVSARWVAMGGQNTNITMLYRAAE